MEIPNTNNGHKSTVTGSWLSCTKEGWPDLEGQGRYTWGVRVEDEV